MPDCPVNIYQSPGEMAKLLAIYRKLKPKKVLEIGALYGGTLWHWMKNIQPGGTVVSVDMIVPTPDHRHEDVAAARKLWPGWETEFGCKLVTLDGSSADPAIIAKARKRGPYDFIFVDGDHSYQAVKSDFENYFPLLRPGGVMAFHDICYPDVNHPHHIDVGRWWREMKAEDARRFEELTDKPGQDFWGIGVIYA